MKGIANAALVAAAVIIAFLLGGVVILAVVPDWIADSETNYWGWLAIRLGWAWACVTVAIYRVGATQWWDGYERSAEAFRLKNRDEVRHVG